MIVIPRQTIKFPHHNRFKLAVFSRGTHLLESFPGEAPAVPRSILINADDNPAPLRNHFTTNGFLIFERNLILHF